MFETTSQISLGEHMKFSLSYPFPNREKGPLKETIWGSPTASSRMPASTKGNPAAWSVPLKRYPHKVMMALQLWKSPLDGKFTAGKTILQWCSFPLPWFDCRTSVLLLCKHCGI